ncbi:MAG TPA: hypothetical protein VIK97_07370, partial [Casimicrobiaceae bacterium]
ATIIAPAQSSADSVARRIEDLPRRIIDFPARRRDRLQGDVTLPDKYNLRANLTVVERSTQWTV